MDTIDRAGELIAQQDRILADAVNAIANEQDERRTLEIEAFSGCFDAIEQLRNLGSLSDDELSRVETILAGASTRARSAAPTSLLPGFSIVFLPTGENPNSNIVANEELGMVWNTVMDFENNPEENGSGQRRDRA